MSNPYDNTRNTKSSVLGPTLKFKGELTADEDLLIQGSIEGSIRHSSSLTIGEGGNIKADVSAEYIVVEGRVEGDLRGSRCVKVRESAKVTGNIVSPNVSLVEGASFNGKIDMDADPKAAAAPKPEARRVEQPAAADRNESGDGANAADADQKSAAARKSGRTGADKKSATAA